ncbi:MAG: hypothetical protein J2P45_23165, partial [Candidatus Dormibacteraeota bacterium]|nr:hypothetical protein [Candidatus Dormibacteraeota bacterium]
MTQQKLTYPVPLAQSVADGESRAYDFVKTVPELVRQRALAQPDTLAVCDAGRSLSYAGLDRWASAIASELAGRGSRHDAVVALFLPRSAAIAAAAL